MPLLLQQPLLVVHIAFHHVPLLARETQLIRRSSSFPRPRRDENQPGQLGRRPSPTSPEVMGTLLVGAASGPCSAAGGSAVAEPGDRVSHRVVERGRGHAELLFGRAAVDDERLGELVQHLGEFADGRVD